jgi:hypothetical protein|nr:MAG TPA: hypothetical protein [Bacteriophage sp.]
MIICFDNQIINLYMGWRAIHLDTNFSNVDWSVNTQNYTVTIELADESSCCLGVFVKKEYFLAKMMMDKIKEGFTKNISFLDLDDYLKMWKRKSEELEKEKETKNG